MAKQRKMLKQNAPRAFLEPVSSSVPTMLEKKSSVGVHAVREIAEERRVSVMAQAKCVRRCIAQERYAITLMMTGAAGRMHPTSWAID